MSEEDVLKNLLIEARRTNTLLVQIWNELKEIKKEAKIYA
jgi:hypothetical protein